ncbi:Protein of unknown function [Ferrimonas sediminum]|uniref:DUF2860 domain-containing protein n=1 Tax=Ferrimonas sediminum TaxID=718193 RepID=A0A1G8WW33_9GAMM|nr:DUF2860 family protein [Ferrimonas sediminum]SDJ82612.1 Protein of unknown function [Ferrimonas sediminum]
MLRAVPAVLMLMGGGVAMAADPLNLPKQSGWSGYLGAGATYYDLSSNFITGNRFVDFDNQQSRGLDSPPASDSQVAPDILVDLRYTFAEHQTQLFFGNLVQDMVRLDFSDQLGVRRQFGDWGIGSLAYLFSAAPNEVWQDPFQVENPRTKTDRDSQGVRLGWDNIADSTIGVHYSYRRIDVDQEQSGAELILMGRLTPEQALQLQRDGNRHRLDLFAHWELSQNQHLTPALLFIERDSDGAANGGQTKGVQLTYVYRGERISGSLSGYFGERDYDEANPIFDREADAEEYGISGNLFVHRLFDLNHWDLRLGLMYFDSSAKVDFYDTDLLGANLSLLYRFR